MRPCCGWTEKPFGTFATKIVVTGHGNHYCDMLVKEPKAGQKINIDLEFYSGHYVMGCMPLEKRITATSASPSAPWKSASRTTGSPISISTSAPLTELVEVLDETQLPQGRAHQCDAWLSTKCCTMTPECVSSEEFYAALEKGQEIMAPALARHNSSTAPSVGVIGHSHMDTAWLWHVGETIKKCARTYSNQLNLMEQYPEYTFVQSSAFHGEVIRRHYPELFQRIQEKVAEGPL